MTNNYRLRGSLWNQPLLSLVQNHLITYPTPSNLTGNWNWGVLAGLCLVLQILTGIFLAMHYTAHVDLAFNSVQHLMRDVPYGWLLRYLHANGASLFFIVVYMHLFRGLYYTSYAQPREAVWLIGVVILLVMILTAFIGYVLPWGYDLALNDKSKLLNFSSVLKYKAHKAILCLYILGAEENICYGQSKVLCAFFVPKIPALKRFGPYNKHIYGLLVGSMLGDGYAEYRAHGTRFCFHYSTKNKEYAFFLHKILCENGYCSSEKPKVVEYKSKNGKVYKSLRFKTFTFASFNSLYYCWYVNKTKKIPLDLEKNLCAISLAVWVIDDGNFTGSGLLIATDCFSKEEVYFLAKILALKYNLKVSVHKKQKYHRLYIHKSSINLFINIVQPYIAPSIIYKLGK